jgi:hypothetical protein
MEFKEMLFQMRWDLGNKKEENKWQIFTVNTADQRIQMLSH